MSRASIALVASLIGISYSTAPAAFGQRPGKDDLVVTTMDAEPRPVSSDPTVKLDYDIVYVRATRPGDAVVTNWAEISSPLFMDPGADLMLLHPDGQEDLLVAGGKGSVADPMVSFDGQWVYYALFHDLEGATVTSGAPAGADIY
jgi:hypothetical protein